MEILSQGREGTGSGVYKPNFRLLGLLVAHNEHPLTYLETLSFIRPVAVSLQISHCLDYTKMTSNKRRMRFSYNVDSFPLWNTQLAKMIQEIIMHMNPILQHG